jgi:hypothetical protein
LLICYPPWDYGPVLRQNALNEGPLEAIGGFDIGLARGEHVRVQERFPQLDERVGERIRLDERDQAPATAAGVAAVVA